MNLKHKNAAHGKVTKEYRAWRNMKDRCYNKKHSSYKNYGGRSIKVCKRWLHSFENFLKDVGLSPSPIYSLDRIDNDGDYKPSNCRWATSKEQTRNRRKFKNCSSKFKGVYFDRGNQRWGTKIFLGYFNSELEAAAAYEQAQIKLSS